MRNPKSSPIHSTQAAARAAPGMRELLLTAIAQHQRGEWTAAIAGYRHVLGSHPRQFDALRLLGAALLAQRQFTDAIEQFDLALSVRANFAEIWRLRGEAQAGLRRHEQATISFEHAVSLEAGDRGAWNNLGLQYAALRRHDEALAAFDRALDLAPQAAVVWTNRGVVLGELGRLSDAVASHARALALEPAAAEIWCNHGKALNEAGNHCDSVLSFDRALQIDPGAAQAWAARGAPLRALCRPEEALECCRRALELDPENSTAWALRGALLSDLQRTVEALDSFDRALALAPNDALTGFNRGLALLTLGRFAAGWEGYEFRHKVPAFATGNVPGAVQWEAGQPLAGRSLLLISEQGLGDTIQFARFVPILAARGARIYLAVRPALRKLMTGLAGVEYLLTEGDPIPPFDLQCRLLSVPRCLGTTLESIPTKVPYLCAPPDRIEHWRAQLDAQAATAGRPGIRRIGLACSGNAEHANDRNRSIPLEKFAPLVAAMRDEGCEFHLLQNELRAQDEPWLERMGVIDHRTELNDFCETAALATCMDAVASVDTSVAHLAGALGLPLQVLLPMSSDWRWLLERKDSPWYPSAQLIRQNRAGDWDTPVAKLLESLRALLIPQGVLAQTRRSSPDAARNHPSAASNSENAFDAAPKRDPAAELEAAVALHKSGRPELAIALYREILQKDATPPEVVCFDARRLLGAALVQQNRHAEALTQLEQALALRENADEVWVLRGKAMAELGRYAEAATSTARALALRPDKSKIWTDQGHYLQAFGQIPAALESFERAVRLEPQNAQYRFHRATALLALGSFDQGWADYEARLAVPEMAMVPVIDRPFWNGQESLAGRTLLLVCEQGLGDTLQFCRYAPLLAARGATVILGVQPTLRDLLRSLPGVAQVLADGDPMPAVDLQCWMMSLAHLLRAGNEAIPAPVPYLQAPAVTVQRWHERLAAMDSAMGVCGRRRIGIVCSGNPRQANDRHRSIPLEKFGRWMSSDFTDVQWHLLQSELRERDEPWLKTLGIVDHRSELTDYCETAALAACMDAVVSVDTSVAHLAGALGLPVFLLLHAGADWRWMLGRQDSPWYPTARLFRQSQLDEWNEPVTALAQALRAPARP